MKTVRVYIALLCLALAGCAGPGDPKPYYPHPVTLESGATLWKADLKREPLIHVDDCHIPDQ